MTSAGAASCISSHGEISAIGRWSSAESKISSAHRVCIQVVPHLGGVLMTMSPARNSKPDHRSLSATSER